AATHSSARSLHDALPICFPGSASWSVETFRGLGSKQALPPDSFWELPANASAAYFAQAPDAARTETFWTVAKDLLAGYLESNPRSEEHTSELQSRANLVC